VPRAVVSGAGIAGLAAGHALRRLGYEVRVLERDERLRSEGAGLTLWSNAVAALRELGLGEVVSQCGRQLTEAAIVSRDGALLSTVPLKRITARFGPTVTVHRAELLAALGERLGGEVEFGAPVSAVGGVLRASGEDLDADLIVGADGINSAVRDSVAAPVRPRDVGYGVWRGVAVTGERTPSRAAEAIGEGRRFGVVPMSGRRTYWFAVVAERDRDVDLDAAFAGWHPPVGAVLEATPARDRTYVPLQDLPRLPSWHRGAAVLVGDAAHAMTPNLGQGAAQAIEDVAVLVRLLREMAPSRALPAYEGIRKRRAERVVAQSRLAGRLLQIESPLLGRFRDRALRLTPEVVSYRQMAIPLERRFSV
jgi:2-polyprenyl-6-methoxyphenol hydroxylase-like FAD-dependent oxidoreductase